MQPNLVAPEGAATTSRPAIFPYGRIETNVQWPATPGADTCPACGANVVDVQGLADCPDCAWTSRAGDR